MRSSGRFPTVAARRWFRAAAMVLVVCVWTAVAFVLVLTIMLVPGLALTVPARRVPERVPSNGLARRQAR
jgi:hypothetical protein